MPLQMLTFTSNPFKDSSGIDTRVHDIYGACFDAIAVNSQVRLAFYMWNRSTSPAGARNPSNLTASLITAVQTTNADARVLFDIDYYELADAEGFKSHLEDGGIAKATFPRHKTAGFNKEEKGSPKLHDKTLLFSKLTFPSDSTVSELAGQTVEHVVLQGSANIWPSQYSQANQVILYHGSEDFYVYHLDLWEKNEADFACNPFSLTKHSPSTHTSDGGKSYAFPRNDILINSVLDNILDDAGTTRPEIRLAMGHFSKKSVATRLAQIADGNPKAVKIVARKGNIKDEVIAALGDGVDLLLLEKDPLGAGMQRKVHAKYLLLNGRYKLGGQTQKRKLTWAGSLNYTGWALDKNSETLVRMQSHGVYDDLYQAWNELRYTRALSSIDAALDYRKNDVIYFFSGGKYVRYRPGFGVETISQNRAQRTIGQNGWKDFPTSFQNDLDAAFWYRYNNKVYFFKNSHYIRVDPDKGFDGGPRRIGVDGWKSLPRSFRNGIDAVLQHPTNNAVYFFRGSKYCRWNPGEGIVEPALRDLGEDGWALPSSFLSGIDAALTHPGNERVYFFKGDEYCRWKVDTGVDFGPAKVAAHWPGVMF